MGSWVGSRGINSSGLNKDGERVTCWKGEKIRDTQSPALKCPRGPALCPSELIRSPQQAGWGGDGLGER